MNAKFILVISLLFNVVLVAFSGVIVGQSRMRPAPAVPVELKASAALPAAPELAPSPAVERFRWNQLESSDEATFAANLRAVGCPEGTLRDILTGAIAHRYDQQRQELIAQHQQGRIDASTLQTALAQTWEQQNAAVGQLPATPTASVAVALTGAYAAPNGGASAAPGAAFSGGVGGGSSTAPASGGAIVTPLALTEPPASLGLTDAQKAAAYRVGDNFSASVGGQNLAPNDPAYRQAWQAQQPNADDALKAQIGWQAFVRWQIQAARGSQ